MGRYDRWEIGALRAKLDEIRREMGRMGDEYIICANPRDRGRFQMIRQRFRVLYQTKRRLMEAIERKSKIGT